MSFSTTVDSMNDTAETPDREEAAFVDKACFLISRGSD